jgi:hypothetical protein
VIGTERTRPLLVPLTVIAYVPLATFFFVSSVSVDVADPVIEAVENRAVTNLGKGPTDSVTLPVNPAPGLTETVYVALFPLVTVLLVGDSEIEKSPATISVTLALLVTGPLVPLIVRMYVPGGVDALVDTASVDEPEPVTELGVNDAVAPDGRPMTPRLATPVNPLIDATVAV